MGLLRKIEVDNADILMTLELTKEEYESISPEMKEFVTLPTNMFDRVLTTGRLGNGNRIMVPSRFLRGHNIEVLRKNVPSKIFTVGEKKFLIIELEDKKPESTEND